MVVQSSYARRHLSELLDEALKGGTVTITRHGKPTAQLTPVPLDGFPVGTRYLFPEVPLGWIEVLGQHFRDYKLCEKAQ